MTDYTYATFDQYGRCATVLRSAVPLELPHEVERGTKPEHIYIEDGVISLRKQITLSVDRDHFIADGNDGPIIAGLPDDATLMVNNEVAAITTSRQPGAMMLETIGEYRSNLVCIMFLPLDELRAKYTAEADKRAGEAREQYLTALPGQANVYAAKEAEAIAWLNRAPGEYPYLAAEADSTEYDDMDRLARLIIERADACRAGLAQIEGLRMSAKQAISTATDVPTMIAALQGIES